MTKVRLGFFSFTEITDPAEHRSYNAWHQLDHMPEQYPLAGVVAGQRWVSTPACRAARAVDGGGLGPVHYMTLYLMAEPLEQTLRGFRALGDRLREARRFHTHRRALLSGPFDVTTMRAAPRVLVSDEAVAFRPTRGVYVAVHEQAALPGGAGDAPPGAGAATARLLGSEGVAGVWTFTGTDRFAALGWGTGQRAVTVCFLDEEPLAVAPALGDVVCSGADGPVLWAGPLESITPWRWDWFDGER